MCVRLLFATLFVIARCWNQPKWPNIEDSLKKLHYIHPKYCNTAGKMNKEGLHELIGRELQHKLLSDKATKYIECANIWVGKRR